MCIVHSHRAGPARRLVLVACAGALLGACADDAVNAPPGPPAALRASAGADQWGEPGAPLPEPLEVTVVDPRGRGARGAVVHWSADDGGRVNPPTSLTDASGRARTVWTLGARNEALHIATATVDGLPPVRFGTAPGDAP